ncbi:MAG: hypothetical protein GQ553_00975 [Nitrosomonadaceae bacterium]|nr:hypothetical protein [Nitrosomonadaceae bacterium]
MSREAKILAHNIQNNPEDFEGEKLEQSLDRFAKAYHQDQVTKQSFNRCGSGDNVCKCTNENECGYTATHSPLTDVTGPPPKESGTGGSSNMSMFDNKVLMQLYVGKMIEKFGWDINMALLKEAKAALNID